MRMNGKIIVLGAGHMGTAIILGIKGSSDRRVVIVDPSATRREFLAQTYGLACEESISQIDHNDVVVLAMQPQTFGAAAKGIHIPRNWRGLIISVMAGITISSIMKSLGVDRVIRSIPNTPSEVFFGMTVCTSSESVTETDVQIARSVLDTFGKTLFVNDESLIDPATAICGGGPAFVAYFADAMKQFSIEAGFSPQDSDAMISQILRGTAELLDVSKKPPMQLCREVMTPKGTTERCIFHFEEKRLKDIVVDGMKQSAARSRELGTVLNAD